MELRKFRIAATELKGSGEKEFLLVTDTNRVKYSCWKEHKELWPKLQVGADVEQHISESNGYKNIVVPGKEKSRGSGGSPRGKSEWKERYQDTKEAFDITRQSIEVQSSAHDAAQVVSAMIEKGILTTVDGAKNAFVSIADCVNTWVWAQTNVQKADKPLSTFNPDDNHQETEIDG